MKNKLLSILALLVPTVLAQRKLFPPETIQKPENREFERTLALLAEFEDENPQWVIYMSPADGSGLRKGTGTSQHIKGRAVDIMTPSIKTKPEVRTFILAAQKFFNGVGFYPHWKPNLGFHLDTKPGAPRTWGGVKKNGTQEYTSLNYAISIFNRNT